MADDETIRMNPAADELNTEAIGADHEPPADSLPARTLLKDRYLLIRQLNRGGFGAVYLAHDKQMHDRAVVVKIQMEHAADDPWFDRKFSEEVRALSMIDHPGVVVAIDSGRTPDGKPFLVMQFVDGVTLRSVLNPEGMPLDRAAAILQQVGHALAAAHSRGILHRDLKPENLMLQTMPDGSERVRLIDFGIASVADLENKFQTSTRVSGTVFYMAPEQFEGQVSELTDIYAMGLIAYEMVTGRRPFIAAKPFQLAKLQRSGVRLKPSDLRPELPIPAERLILKSLEYQPSARPSNARDFGDQLRDTLLGSGLAGAPTRRVVKTKKESRRVWIAAAVLLTVALVRAGFLLRNHAEAPKPQVKVQTAPKDTNTDSPVESAFWEAVKDSSDPQFYREYLAKYPQGRFASLAKLKLEILAKRAAAKPPGNPAEPVNGAREEDADDGFQREIQKSADPKLYQQYLKEYPPGYLSGLARKRAAQSKNNPPGVIPPRVPMPAMPDLSNVPGVNPNISAELAYWNAIKDSDEPQPFKDYLKKYPNGMFTKLAELKIANLNKEPAQ